MPTRLHTAHKCNKPPLNLFIFPPFRRLFLWQPNHLNHFVLQRQRTSHQFRFCMTRGTRQIDMQAHPLASLLADKDTVRHLMLRLIGMTDHLILKRHKGAVPAV